MTTVPAPALVLPLGRAAAVLAVGSAAVHLALAAGGELSAVAMALMAAACLPCAWHLWRAPSGQVWALTALVDAGMLAVHAPMVLGGGHAGMAHGPSSLAVAGLALVGGQLLLAGVALLRRGARWTRLGAGPPPRRQCRVVPQSVQRLRWDSLVVGQLAQVQAPRSRVRTGSPQGVVEV